MRYVNTHTHGTHYFALTIHCCCFLQHAHNAQHNEYCLSQSNIASQLVGYLYIPLTNENIEVFMLSRYPTILNVLLSVWSVYGCFVSASIQCCVGLGPST